LFLAGIAQQQVLSVAHCHAVIAGLGDGLLRTCFNAFGAEDTTAEIQRDRIPSGTGDGFGWANGHAGTASVGALRGIDLERTSMAVGQRWCRTLRVVHCLAAGFEPVEESVVDEHGVN
jgi:hypothetical protein